MSDLEGQQITEAQREALAAELSDMEGPQRAAAVEAIAHARAFGDLSENFEYHAAKNEQGLLEARIRTLRARLDGAQIVEDAGSDEVGVGSVVDVAGDGGQAMTVEISAVGGAGTVSPCSSMSIANAAGFAPKPGICSMSPQSGTSMPAPE